MILTEQEILPAVIKSGQETDISITAGQSLKIEISPGGDEILEVECPAGKMWTARVIVEVTETDA